MPVFYFRGTIAEFWQFIYKEYMRWMSAKHMHPFIISGTSLSSPLASYQPQTTDAIYLNFDFGAHAEKTAVSVKAVNHLDAEVVELYVDVYVSALKKDGGDSAYQRWLALQNKMKSKGLLVNPVAKFELVKTRDPQRETTRKIQELREYRLTEQARSGNIPKLTFALNYIKIAHRTVKTHAEDLIKNWKVEEYE